MIVATAIAATAWFAVTLPFVQIDRTGAGDAATHLVSLKWYWFGAGIGWLALSLVAWALCTGRSLPFAGRPARAAACILLVATGVRVFLVLAATPQLSDDIWRYIHDGRQLVSGTSPYAFSPAQLGAGRGDDPILDQINHPELVSIYLPTSQYTFAGLWAARPARLDPLGEKTFRAGFALIDLAIVGVLLVYLIRQKRSAWWATLYAWHPLTLSEVAGSGHQDVIGILLLVGALALVGGAGSRSARAFATAAGLAASSLVKPFALVVALPIAWRWRGDRKRFIAAASGGFLVAVALVWPLAAMDGGVSRLIETSRVFAGTWAFNSSLHQPIVSLSGSKMVADVIITVMLLCVLAGCVVTRESLWRIAQLFLFAALLCSSTAHPWYLLWALVLIPLRFDAALWAMSLTITWSYAVLVDPVAWRLPAWVVVLEYTPVYLLLVLSLIRLGRTRMKRSAQVRTA